MSALIIRAQSYDGDGKANGPWYVVELLPGKEKVRGVFEEIEDAGVFHNALTLMAVAS